MDRLDLGPRKVARMVAEEPVVHRLYRVARGMRGVHDYSFEEGTRVQFGYAEGCSDPGHEIRVSTISRAPQMLNGASGTVGPFKNEFQRRVPIGHQLMCAIQAAKRATIFLEEI